MTVHLKRFTISFQDCKSFLFGYSQFSRLQVVFKFVLGIIISGEVRHLFAKVVAWLDYLKPGQLLALAGAAILLMFSIIYFFLSWWTEKELSEYENVSVTNTAEVVEKESVVVARFDIPMQTTITDLMLEVKEIPVDSIPSGAITDISDAVNVSAKTTIFAGDVITQKKLTADVTQNSFIGLIPKDCRAVSIGINEITSVNGLAKPGDKVDLMSVEVSSDKSVTTRIFLQDVLLLSVNKSTSESDESTEAPSTATFALRPEEVLKLVAASKLGDIYMVLRPSNPSERYSGVQSYRVESVDTYKKNLAEKNKLEKEKEKAEAVKAQNPPQVPENKIEAKTNEDKIEIIQGDKVNK